MSISMQSSEVFFTRALTSGLPSSLRCRIHYRMASTTMPMMTELVP